MPNPIRRRRLGGSFSYPNRAAQLTAASTQFATLADNASLSGGATLDMSWVAWVNFDSFGTSRNIMSKYASAGVREYLLWFNNAVTQFQVTISADGTATKSIAASTFGTPSTGTWYFVVARYDGTNLAINVNAGTQNTTAHTTDVFDAGSRFTIGSTDGSISLMNGRDDCLGIFKSARGAGGALSTADITTLYNNGVGMAWRDLPTALKSVCVAYWNLDGDLTDASGNGNNLVDNGGITYGIGKR